MHSCPAEENEPRTARDERFAIELGDAVDSYRFVIPDGNDGVGISSLSAADQAQVLESALSDQRKPADCIFALCEHAWMEKHRRRAATSCGSWPTPAASRRPTACSGRAGAPRCR